MGVASALSGKLMGSALSNAFVVVGLAILFIALAASMFGAFEIALPSGLTNKLSTVGGVGFKGAFVMGLVMGLIAALVQYQDWQHVAYVAIVFAIGQTLEGYVLVPRLVGEKIGLHPVAVIFAVLAGGELFGFVGVLLALPVASVVMVLLRYAHERYTASELYRASDEPVIVVVGGENAVPEPSVIVVERSEDS
jgi:predicted PurR-regulated permease PerM